MSTAAAEGQHLESTAAASRQQAGCLVTGSRARRHGALRQQQQRAQHQHPHLSAARSATRPLSPGARPTTAMRSRQRGCWLTCSCSGRWVERGRVLGRRQ